MLRGRKALFINVGWEQEPYVERLVALGVDVVAVHNTALENPPIGISDLLVCDYFDIAAICKFAYHHRVEAVITDQCDYALYASAVVAKQLGLPGPKITAAQLTTNKWLQRKAIATIDVMQPAFQLCLGPESISEFADRESYPIIVKPVDARGSFGVSRVDRADEIENAYFNALLNSPARLVIVEKFIHGVQLTIDGFCIDGRPQSLAIASKGMLDNKTQVAVDIHYPAKVSRDIVEEAKCINYKVAAQLGLDYGCIHGEYMLAEDGSIYLIEIANRGGGCFTASHAVPAVSGFNIVDNLIFSAFGVPLNKTLLQHDSAVLLKFFCFEKKGEIKAISGLDTALASPGVLAGRINLGPGDVVGSITDDSNRHGFFIVSGSCDDVYQKFDNALDYIYLDVEYVE